MSKDRCGGGGADPGANLRLLGSPVQLAYRGGRGGGGGGRKPRSRPRSAASHSCHSPSQERSKRPFSADTKTDSCSIRNLLKGAEQGEFNINEYFVGQVKVVPPTTALLENHNNSSNSSRPKNRLFYSNASEHGSEDTYVSLGTKIKTKAQMNNQDKFFNKKYLKYRDIAKKDKDQNINEPPVKEEEKLFDFKVTISENKLPNYKNNHRESNDGHDQTDLKPSRQVYESYFDPADPKSNISKTESLAGRVSFGTGLLNSEIENVIDSYTRRLSLNKQQLSLVEEESIRDLESMPSEPYSSLSPQASFDKNDEKLNIFDEPKEHKEADGATYIVDIEDPINKYTPRKSFDLASCLTKSAYESGARTYDSFYDDFTDNRFHKRNNATHSSTVLNTHSLEYTTSDPTTVHTVSYHTTFPKTTELSTKVIKHVDKNLNVKSDGENHSSLECIALDNLAEINHHKLTPRTTSQWSDTPRHSRLLYKDFFLTKSPEPIPKSNFAEQNHEIDAKNIEIQTAEAESNDTVNEYPDYLSNSISKAYTSKVIDDYKKEIQAIDNLHDLTLKDIKTESISPTPLNIDVMFEQTENEVNVMKVNHTNKFENFTDSGKQDVTNTNSRNNEIDVSNISTTELIQNYFRVKDGNKQPKTPKRKPPEKTFDRKNNNSADININGRPSWSFSKNSTIVKPKNIMQSASPLNLKINNRNTEITHKPPLSSRIECVQNDKDVDSWISITDSTPKHEFTTHIISSRGDIPFVGDKSNNTDTDRTIQDNFQPEKNSISDEKEIVARIVDNETEGRTSNDLTEKATVMDIYSMLKEIESFGDNPVASEEPASAKAEKEQGTVPKDNFMEIFTFLEKVEHSANEALSVVTSSAPQVIPKLEMLLRLPQTELAQRYLTAALQLEERSCCIALLQESLANHKEQMIVKVSNLEKQSHRNIGRVKQECEEAIKRHQTFIDQLINDKKTLNHRIEQLVDERRALEERWKRSTQALEDRYKLQLKNQHDKMAAAQQVARQRWVRQKAEKIKELTVKGLEGELREMADRQQQEVSQVKMSHAEQVGRMQAKHAAELERLRRTLEEEAEAALMKERQLASSRMEKQILELERTYQEQRSRLVTELRAESERAAAELAEREKQSRADVEKWRQEQEQEMQLKMSKLNEEIARQREILEEQLGRKRESLAEELEQHKRQLEQEQQALLKKKATEIAAQHKRERDSEIEKAIESMEAEAQAGRRELQEALRRNMEQYETELRALGETEKATLRRYQEAQARVRQTEDKCADLENTVSQLEAKNRTLADKYRQLESQVSEAERGAAASWAARLEALQQEMDSLKKTHEEQMHQLYAKVKVAVARKDSAIQALTRESDKAQEKVTLLEQRLQQQRKDFLKHK